MGISPAPISTSTKPAVTPLTNYFIALLTVGRGTKGVVDVGSEMTQTKQIILFAASRRANPVVLPTLEMDV